MEAASPSCFGFRRAALGLVCAALAGCGGRTRPAPPEPRAWPPPPAAARVRLRQVVTEAADLRTPGFTERLAALLIGGTRQTLLGPQDVAVDEQWIYVADQEHQGVHVFERRSGKSRFLDRAGETYFVSPAGVAALEGGVAVSDSALRRVFVLSPSGELERAIDAPGGFQRPTGLAYDVSQRRLYVVDTLANRVWLFDARGRAIRSFGVPGTGEGQFNYPTYIALDEEGRIVVTDSLNFRVQIFDARERFVRAIGSLGDATGFMAVPKGVGLDRNGHLYVVDSLLSTVQIFDLEGRFLLAFGERGDGPGSFQVPTGLAVGPGGLIYVCDSYSRRLQVFEIMEPPDETADTR